MLNVIVHFLIVLLNIYMLTFSMLNVTVLSVVLSYCYVDRYVKCHYAEGRGAAAKTTQNLLRKCHLSNRHFMTGLRRREPEPDPSVRRRRVWSRGRRVRLLHDLF
jgi:hypothetical protein